jgi:hypothetical protein
MTFTPGPSDPQDFNVRALLNAVVSRHDRVARDELVTRRPILVLANGARVTIFEYIIARCTGRQGPPLPSGVDPDLLYDILVESFFDLPE